MTKLHLSLLGTILGASILAFSGCGGDDDSSSSDVSTAYLVDSAVKGVTYRCGTQSGTTGADGAFNYQHGQTCTFNIGATTFSVAADKLAAGKSITPYDIFAGDDEKVVNLARLLQTLDSDHNASLNGIDINTTAHALITTNIRFDSNFDADLNASVYGTAYSNIVTPVVALTQLAPNVPAPTSYTAFERIAEIDLSDVNGSGAANSNNPTTVAKYVARKIAKHFYMTNDTNVSSNADWVLGGAPYNSSTGATTLNPDTNVSALDPYILAIPSPDDNKSMIVEVCNKKHAGLAMSMGAENSPALPCEISIYMDATTNKIYIDILDPVGSFAIFFNKITTNQDMLTAMALQVKTEIKLISYNALKEAAITHVKKATPMGPTFTPAQIQALNNQYLTYTYDINTSSSAWLAADTNITKKYQVANLAASALISAMTVNSTINTFGINGTDLNATLVGSVDYNLSETGYWRSARSAALKVPRSTAAADDFIYTVEACSPTYAKIALSLGNNGDSRNHTAALPCQMSFYIDNSDANHPKLKIVFLNPAFMFQTLFSDMMSQTHSQGYTPESLNAMVTTVSNDLVNMTRYVMDHNVTSVIPYSDKTN